MPESLAFVTALAGFGLIIVAGARLGAGSHLSLAGLVPAHGQSDWPQGVQEPDAPRFAVAHADALRRDATPATADLPAQEFDTPEIIDVYERPLGLGSR